jgi:uncharacterized protein (DUF952 family)
MTNELIFHMCRQDEWLDALAIGRYAGSSQDKADGFIHFSTASQIVESAAKHRAGQDDLVLLAVTPEPLGAALRWETARNGALFPHLYGELSVSSVTWTAPLRLGADGRHIFPSFEP